MTLFLCLDSGITCEAQLRVSQSNIESGDDEIFIFGRCGGIPRAGCGDDSP